MGFWQYPCGHLCDVRRKLPTTQGKEVFFQMCTCLQQTFSLGKGGKGKTECSSKGQSPWSDLIAGSDEYPWIQIDVLTSSALYLCKEEKFLLMRFYNTQKNLIFRKNSKGFESSGAENTALERERWYWGKKITSQGHLRRILAILCSWQLPQAYRARDCSNSMQSKI